MVLYGMMYQYNDSNSVLLMQYLSMLGKKTVQQTYKLLSQQRIRINIDQVFTRLATKHSGVLAIGSSKA